MAGLVGCAKAQIYVFLPCREGGRMSQMRRKRRGRRIKNVRWSGDARKMRNRYQAKVYRQVKDRLFRFLFGKNKDALLQLYNALNGTDYEDTTGMEIVTIESAVYVVMNNDAAFIFAGTLSLYEHQSTMNKNMPVRFLLYLAEEYQKVIEKAESSLYGSRRITLPIPKCVVFYNGEQDAREDAAESWEMYLSDAFSSGKKNGVMAADVEVRVHVLNINYGHNKKLMEKCPLLEEYSHFVAVSRECLAKGMDRQEAYIVAVDYCIEHNILRDFLRENRMEVIGMLLREFDVEKYERSLREEGREEGKSQGLTALIRTLKPMLNDIDKVYEAIIGNEAYADVTRETVQEYYHTT